MAEEGAMRPLGKLGVRGRARGRAQYGDIIGTRRGDHAFVASGIAVQRSLA